MAVLLQRIVSNHKVVVPKNKGFFKLNTSFLIFVNIIQQTTKENSTFVHRNLIWTETVEHEGFKTFIFSFPKPEM